MTFGFRATAAAGLALAIAGTSFGQSSSDYQAIITEGGELKLLANAQQVMQLRFGLFYDGWRSINQSAVGRQADGSYLSRAALSPGDLNISTTVAPNGYGARFTIRATPTRNLLANAAHLNFRLEPTFWAGATAIAGSQTLIFPRRTDETFYKSGTTDRFSVQTPSGFKVSMQTSGSGSFAIRDSRPYVGFEIRAMDGGNFTWYSGSTRTYVVDVTPNVSMPFGPDQPVSVVQNSDWIPLTHMLRVSPGSALDWSKPNPTYAGSKGWLKANSSGRFYFESEPNVPVRFYGTNITSAGCFPSQAEADAIATELARRGYNAVRFNHADMYLVAQYANNSTTLDPWWVDRFMYLIEALKRKGIYIHLELYSFRKTKADEIYAGTGLSYGEYKAALLCNDAVRQNYLTFSRNLLDTFNPYAGKKLKDDPGIAWIGLVNENNPIWIKPEHIRAELLNQLSAAAGQAWDVTTDAGARRADELLTAEYEFLKAELRSFGVKSLFSMAQGEQSALSRTHSRLDFVDNHVYYAFPGWLGTPYHSGFTQEGVPPIARIQDLGRASAARIHGKPYTVSEWDGATPNAFRGEMGLLMGAVASIQQWDAVYRYTFIDRMERFNNLNKAEVFCTITDPSSIATDRALTALYLRGDLAYSDPHKVIYVAADTAGLSELKHVPIVTNAALRIPMSRSNSVGETLPGTPILDGISQSTNGAVYADLFSQVLKVNTPRTCGVTASPGLTHTAGRLSVKFQKSRGSVWATSLDGLELGSSKRILLTHLTEIQNAGTTWTGVERRTVTHFGNLPHLARDGSATVTITGLNLATARAFRLDMSGRRIAQVYLSKATGGAAVTVSTKNPADGTATIFYEIVQ